VNQQNGHGPNPIIAAAQQPQIQQLTITATPQGITVSGVTDKLLAIAMLETAKHTILLSMIGSTSTQPANVIVPAMLVPG